MAVVEAEAPLRYEEAAVDTPNPNEVVPFVSLPEARSIKCTLHKLFIDPVLHEGLELGLHDFIQRCIQLLAHG